MADEGSKRWMTAAIPALGAALLIGGLIVFTRGGGTPPMAPIVESASASAPPPPIDAAPIAPMPTFASATAPTPSLTVAATASTAPEPSSSIGLPVAPSEYPTVGVDVTGPAPSVVPGKKWTDAEKLQKLQASIANVELREKSLQDEITAAEKAGNKADADDKKVLLQRVRARKAELQKALADGDASKI